MIGGGGRWDRAACRDMTQTCPEVARARQRETTFAGWALRQSRPQREVQHLAGVAVNLRCSMWPVVLGLCALSLSKGRGQGLRSLLTLYVVRMYQVYPLPRIRGTGFVCVRVPNPQHQQHRITTPPAPAVASRRWSRVLAPQRVNPSCRGQDV